MRARRRFLVLVLAFVLVTGTTQPVEALEFEQKCNGPHVSAQSGRITLTPGLNGKAVRQRLQVRISLFSCSPARDTRGSGTIKSSFLTKRARGCGLLSTTTAFKVKATVIWKNETKSNLQITFKFTGRAHNIVLAGKVSSGKYAGHKVSSAYHYTPNMSPYPTTFKKACQNKVKPNGRDRKSVVSLDTYSTKPFVIR